MLTGTEFRPCACGPLLQTAVEFTQFRTRTSVQITRDCWILDYNFTPGERVRVRSAASSWMERPANVAHLYSPGFPYWEDVGKDGQPVFVHCAYIHMADSSLLNFSTLLPHFAQYARFFDEEGIVGKLLRDITSATAAGEQTTYWQAHASLFDILAALGQASYLGDDEYRIRPAQLSLQAPIFVSRVVAYIHAHIGEPIIIAQLAGEVGMSPSSLAHRYRAEVGETPMATLRQERIKLAKALLAKGYRLKEIADQVGFSDEYHLSKAFKKMEGVSPRQFRSIAAT